MAQQQQSQGIVVTSRSPDLNPIENQWEEVETKHEEQQGLQT